MENSIIFIICKAVFSAAMITVLLIGIYTIHAKLGIKYGIKKDTGKELGYTYKLSYSYTILAITIIVYAYSVIWSSVHSKTMYDILYLYGIPITVILNALCGFKRVRLIINTIICLIFVALTFMIVSIIL